jgi:hypothetical protein
MIASAKVLTTLKNLNGQLFGAFFQKADGSHRRMVCRLGVDKGRKGGGYSHTKDVTRHNMTVYEMAGGGRYRAIPINRLITLKIAGRVHAVV